MAGKAERSGDGQKKSPGRPQGAKTQDLDNASVAPSVCKHCGSIRRTKYTGTITSNYPGVRKMHDADGNIVEVEYESIVKRRTVCLDCHRPRWDWTWL
jgi:hypothetical protein